MFGRADGIKWTDLACRIFEQVGRAVIGYLDNYAIPFARFMPAFLQVGWGGCMRQPMGQLLAALSNVARCSQAVAALIHSACSMCTCLPLHCAHAHTLKMRAAHAERSLATTCPCLPAPSHHALLPRTPSRPFRPLKLHQLTPSRPCFGPVQLFVGGALMAMDAARVRAMRPKLRVMLVRFIAKVRVLRSRSHACALLAEMLGQGRLWPCLWA